MKALKFLFKIMILPVVLIIGIVHALGMARKTFLRNMQNIRDLMLSLLLAFLIIPVIQES